MPPLNFPELIKSMSPKFKSMQPFSTVRSNWGAVGPSFTNTQTTLSFGVLFLNIIALIPELIAHGFTFPRITPLPPDLDVLEPNIEHPNEFITPQHLAEAKMAQIAAEEEEELDKLVGFYKAKAEAEMSQEKGRIDEEQKTAGQVEQKPDVAEGAVPSRVVWVTEDVVTTRHNQTTGSRTMNSGNPN
jgi:hypothetical protein